MFSARSVDVNNALKWSIYHFVKPSSRIHVLGKLVDSENLVDVGIATLIRDGNWVRSGRV